MTADIIPLRAKPTRRQFTASRNKYVCQLCGYSGYHGWIDLHIQQWHYMCSCGRWFVSVGAHLAALKRHGKPHDAAISA